MLIGLSINQKVSLPVDNANFLKIGIGTASVQYRSIFDSDISSANEVCIVSLCDYNGIGF